MKSCLEKASGAQRDRPELLAALDYLRAGDSLVVWKLARLARSLKQLIETVELLESRSIGLRSLTEASGAPPRNDQSLIRLAPKTIACVPVPG